MSQSATFEPATSWKELYDRIETAWSGPIHEMLQSEAFAAAMGATREQYLTGHQASRENLEAYWEQMRLPSKNDIARLGTMVIGLESRLETLEDRMEALDDRMMAIATRLDQVVTLLERAATRSPEPVVAVELAEAATSDKPRKTPPSARERNRK